MTTNRAKLTATGEPALTTSTITAVLAAAIALLVSLGIDVSDELKVALIGFVAVVAPLVSGIITRSKVTPSAEVAVQATPGGLVAGDALPEHANGTPVAVV